MTSWTTTGASATAVTATGAGASATGLTSTGTGFLINLLEINWL
jgi:hypothetical protein